MSKQTPEKIASIISGAWSQSLNDYHNVYDFEEDQWDRIKNAENEVAGIIAKEREERAELERRLAELERKLAEVEEKLSWCENVLIEEGEGE